MAGPFGCIVPDGVASNLKERGFPAKDCDIATSGADKNYHNLNKMVESADLIVRLSRLQSVAFVLKASVESNCDGNGTTFNTFCRPASCLLSEYEYECLD